MKLTHAAIIALFAVLITVSGFFWASVRRHVADVAKIAAELDVAKANEKNCASAIAAQNSAIEKIRVDTLYLEREVSRVVTKYSVIRDTVTKILEKDNSCESQVNLIDGLLRGFADGRMRPESLNKD